MGKEILQLHHITKIYPNGVIANQDIDMSVTLGEIHALSGENGAGKTTLMKILFGEEEATEGTIYIDEKPVRISSPMDAIKLGIGFVHQHFMLVPSLTVFENMILGMEPTVGLKIDIKKSIQMVSEISKKYNLTVDPNKKVRDLTVGQMQKVEILKVLLRGAKIIILDEPTAVLTPQETKELFEELKLLKEDQYTIIFISHKLNEVKALCDRITVIRRGRTMGVYSTSDVSEQEISRLMVGRDVVLKTAKKQANKKESAISIHDLRIINKDGKFSVNDISLTVRYGEILGIAGVEGNGQSELANAITGNGTYHSGSIKIKGKTTSKNSVHRVRQLGVSHIPEDRMVMGIAPRTSIIDNMIADKISYPHFSRFGILRKKPINEYGKKMVKEYQIHCKSPEIAINSLSGGNIQKAVLARELSSSPKILVANQPTRGVDIGATEFIRNQIVSIRDNGNAVLLISSDLNEILELSDSIVVLYEGKIAAYFPEASTINEEVLGQYMLGLKQQPSEQIKEAYYDDKTN